MLKLDPCPSHSWWWDSHNSPKHSKWLQSNLRELDEKVKEMLTVIEEDADSFAQRAEMYYQKRPKLVNLVEEFYRAYRSLAERYDHLTGEIRQNIPRALQLQYGLSCDSPRPSGNSNGSNRHAHSSPLRKSSAHLSQSLKNPPADPSDDNAPFRTPDKLIFRKCNFNGGSEPCSSPQDKHTIVTCSSNEDTDQRKTLDRHSPGENANFLLSDTENLSEKENENENIPSYDAHSSSPDSEGGGRLTLLDGLQQEIETLSQEKKFLADSHQDAAQRNSLLLQEMKLLQDELARSREEVQALQSRMDELLSNNKKSSMVIFQQAEVENAEGRNHQQMDFSSGKEQEVLPILEEEYDYSAGEEELPGCHEVATRGDDDKHKPTNSCCMQCGGDLYQKMGPDVAVMIKELQDQVASLAAENENQKAAIVERGEEKKEAIRQLCFAMDVLKSRNQRLQEMVGVLMKRRNADPPPPPPPRRSVGEAPTFSFDWSKFFRGEWRSCRTTVQPLTLAL